MIKTRIISAFPGTGKTTFYRKNMGRAIDSDSISFSGTPGFPQNYIDHIKENIGRYEFILVSTHKDVRDALRENCLFFYLVYPESSARGEYVRRYRDRGSDYLFVDLLESNWDRWIRQCDSEQGCHRIELPGDLYLEDAIDELGRVR